MHCKRSFRLVPSHYLCVFEVRVAWSEWSAQGVMGTGYFSFAFFRHSMCAMLIPSHSRFQKLINGDWVQVCEIC